MGMRIDWLSLAYDDDGRSVRSLAIDFLYQPFRHIGLGADWHGLMIDLGVDESDWRGRVHLNYQGPAAFATVLF